MDARSAVRPRVTIGVPVYNGEQFLAVALDAMLAQSFADFEIIVADNASTDRTGEIAQAYAACDPRVRYHRNPENVGAMRNYNLVFGLARSEYFKWWAVDDLCAPTFFERCVEALDRNPAAVLAYSHAASIDAAGDVTSHYETYLGWAGLSPRPQVRFSRLLSEFLATEGLTAPIYLAGLFRRRALAGTRLLGNYIGADLTLVSELALAGTLVEVPEPLTSIRAHEGSSSTGEATSRPEAMHEFINPGLGGRLAVLHTRARRFPAFVEVILRSSLGLPARLTLAAHTIWTLAGYILVHYSPLGLG